MGNWIIAAILALAAIIGVTVASNAERSNREVRSSYVQSLAGSMLVYRNQVVRYAEAHKTVTGVVEDSALSLPTWYKKNSDIKNYVVGGLGYVYVNVQNDGQAYDLLKAAHNDINVGINKTGSLYNPIAGSTNISIPTVIPNGAVVFAPAALSTATLPPTGANCSVAGNTSRSWTVAMVGCQGMTGFAATTVNHGQSLSMTSVNGNLGDAAFLCNNGTLATAPNPGATCTSPPPSGCTAPSSTNAAITRTLTPATRNVACPAGESGTHTQSQTVTESGTRTTSWTCPGPSSSTSDAWSGSYTYGTWTTTTNTCTPTAAPCALPSPSTETRAETSSESQTINGCPAGYYGTVTQTRPLQRTQSRTATCPAATGPYAWSPYGAWSGWSATGGWSTTSSTCTACPAASAQTDAPYWQPNNPGCPSPQTGSRSWEAEHLRTRSISYACPAGTATLPAQTVGTWGAWIYTGNRRNEVNTCTAPPTGRWEWVDTWDGGGCGSQGGGSGGTICRSFYPNGCDGLACNAANEGISFVTGYAERMDANWPACDITESVCTWVEN